MRVLKGLIVFVVLFAVVAIGVAFVLPGSAHVERSITIDRPASQVFAVVNSYRRFNDWSPWADRDPNAHYAVSGPVSGVGARQSWVGDPNTVGSGSQQIVASTPNTSVTTQLDFGNRGQAEARFLLAAQGQGTKVTWTLDAQAPLALDGRLASNAIGRYVALFMDRIVGPDYDAGLRKLKALVESFAAVDVSGVSGEATQLAPRKIYFISAHSQATAESAKAVLTEAYASLGKYLRDAGIAMQGPPLTITTTWDAGGWTFDAAMPVERNDAATRDTIQAGTTYAGPALKFLHVGPYDALGATITKAYAWAEAVGYKTTGRLIEDYLSDPGTTPADQLETSITIPIE